MQVHCLRCNTSLEKYSVSHLAFQPYGADAHAVLECGSCGHVEFVTRNSPMLSNLEMVPTLVGDGD